MHGFHDGHPEALVQGREEEGGGGVEEDGEFGVGEKAGEEDTGREAEGAGDMEEAGCAVARGAGEDEAERAFRATADEEGEGGEEEFVVFVEPEVGGVEEARMRERTNSLGQMRRRATEQAWRKWRWRMRRSDSGKNWG